MPVWRAERRVSRVPTRSPFDIHMMSTPIVSPADCQTVVRALWDYLDRQLDEPQMAAIDAHLAECANCRAHSVFEQRLMDEIGAVRGQHEDPAELRTRVLDTIRRARAEEQK
jgi:mycothiol system anti-sigma-R factor